VDTQSPFTEQFPCPFVAFRHGHDTAIEAAPDFIALFLGGQNLFDCQIACLGHDHFNCFAIEFGKLGKLAQAVDIELIKSTKSTSLRSAICWAIERSPFLFLSYTTLAL
jgi:hypothetical protein